MRRLTVCFSMYSDMSIRTIASSSSKRRVARARASSVFPTPVGPRNRNEPTGRLGSARPARDRRIASATAATASRWSTTRSWRRSSSCRSFCISPSIRRVTGIPVQRLTTSAMSSESTSSLRRRPSPRARRRSSCAASRCSSSRSAPYRSRAARSRSAARSAFSISTRVSSILALVSRISPIWVFSWSHRVRSARLCSLRSAISRSIRASRSREAGSVSLRSASRSISSCMVRRSASSRGAGLLSISIRSRLAASSIRSIALSGRKRSLMYRSERVAAAMTALSVMWTPWWTSYFSLRPRRIEIVSSTLGSSTKMGWNRRSSAGSFSMCLRYSSRVVAPIACSSPRASIGFSMLLASIAPSAAPAPTTVCSSSMKRMISPADSVISRSTAFSRSSNSPRNFVPAISDPRSRATTRLRRSPSGTSPRTIRWARPSTIAVLPTPGSPIRTGLFLVRRASTWTTLRISSSRPITGSSLPSRAACVRSRP